MKTRIWQALVAASVLALLPASRGDETKISKDVAEPSNAAPSAKERERSGVQADTPPATDTSPAKTPAPANPPPVEFAPATPGQAAKLNLSPVLDQVVRLSKSGTDDAVIHAYVEKAASPYLITGNDIIQLQEMGVSKSTIMALIDHSKSATTSSEPIIAQPTPPEPQQANAAVTAPATPPNDAVNDYRDALAPYGTWANLPNYGWCWQPTVVVVNPEWRPYCDNGGWAWSDYGWYWNSYYSWGWAPFHYGRWFCHANRGWFWCPDRVWGPSWVSWRNSASHCGWAPLPPGACFNAGSGWTFHGARVGVDFAFGLGAAHFTFVAHDKFVDRHVGRHSVAGRDVFQQSTVVNNYVVGSNNRIVNQGIGRERIAAATGAPIRETAVRDLSRGANQFAVPTRVNRVATPAFGVQPNAQRGLPVNPAGRALVGRSPVTQAGQSPAMRTFNPSIPAMNQRVQSRATFVGGNAAARMSPSGAPRIQAAPPARNWNAAPVSRGAPAGGYRSFARPAAPAQVTRSFAAPAAQRSFAAPSFAARPMSAGGVRSGGNVSRGAMASAAR